MRTADLPIMLLHCDLDTVFCTCMLHCLCIYFSLNSAFLCSCPAEESLHSRITAASVHLMNGLDGVVRMRTAHHASFLICVLVLLTCRGVLNSRIH